MEQICSSDSDQKKQTMKKQGMQCCEHTKEFSLYAKEWDPTEAASASQARLTALHCCKY